MKKLLICRHGRYGKNEMHAERNKLFRRERVRMRLLKRNTKCVVLWTFGAFWDSAVVSVDLSSDNCSWESFNSFTTVSNTF